MSNWYKVILSGRARYKGQLQGDEYRPGDVAFMERLDENELMEGEQVGRMRAMFKNKKMDELNKYIDKLRTEGFSDGRIQSMITRATYEIKF